MDVVDLLPADLYSECLICFEKRGHEQLISFFCVLSFDWRADCGNKSLTEHSPLYRHCPERRFAVVSRGVTASS